MFNLSEKGCKWILFDLLKQKDILMLFSILSEYGVDVFGVDLSNEMIMKANHYLETMDENTKDRLVIWIYAIYVG